MEEEKKEEIETLGNTGTMEPIKEETVETPAEPVVEETTVESPIVEPAVEEPVVDTPVEAPADPVVEPVVETPAEPVAETPIEEAPVETPTEPVAETPVESAPVEPTPETPAPAETPAETPVEPAKTEEPKKKSKLPLILLIIIILALGEFAVWYFVLGGNGSKKEQKEEPKQEEKKEEEKKEDTKPEEKAVELADTEVESLNNIVKLLSTNFGDYYEKSIGEINNQDLLFFGIKQYEFKDSITEKEMEDIIKKYFGNSVNLKHEDVKCFVADHEPLYNYSEGIYTNNKNHGGHGKEGSFAYPTYVSGEKKGNIITANYKIVYTLRSDAAVTMAFYSSPINQAEALISSDEPLQFSTEVYEKIKDKIPVTEFTFEEIDGNITMKSFKVNK